MSAFVIASVKIKDPGKFQEYSQGVGPTLAAHGGQPVARGQVVETLVGTTDHAIAAIVEFQSVEHAKAWYQSDAYQALKPIRDQAADVTMVLYAAPQA